MLSSSKHIRFYRLFSNHYVNVNVEYNTVWWSHSFVCILHYLTIVIMQTYLRILNFTILVEYILSSVSKIKSIVAVINMQYMGLLCIQLTHFSYDDCENMCTSFYYHHQIGSMTHLPFLGLDHETLVCVVCFSYVSNVIKALIVMFLWNTCI